jgi:hypothetical protein
LTDIESSSKDLAADLKDLYISSVKEVEVAAGKKALVIFVPFRQHKKFQKINSRIVRELEKKFAGKHVLFIAQRTIMAKSVRFSLPCPQSLSYLLLCPLSIILFVLICTNLLNRGTSTMAFACSFDCLKIVWHSSPWHVGTPA